MEFSTIYVWPDATWRHVEEYCEEVDKWKGDDYYVMKTDSSMDDEDIEESLSRGLFK